MLRSKPGKPADDNPPAPRSQLPVIIGSFMTGVAAMTLVGVVAPAIATASAPDRSSQEARVQTFQHSPVAFTEISEEQRRYIEARLAAAEQALAKARAETDQSLIRLDRLAPVPATGSTDPSPSNP